MSRVVAALAVAAAVALAWLSAPAAAPPDLGTPVAAAPVRTATCFVAVDREGSGALAIASSLAGAAPVTVVAGGSVLREVDAVVGLAGGAIVPFDLVTGSGLLGALIELPGPRAGAAVVQRGSGGVGAADCTPPGRTAILAPGGSTRSGETLRLVLANPYTADAVVSVSSSSESGIDAASELESVIVPSRSTVVRDLDVLLPLRSSLSVDVSVDRGAVHAWLLEEGEGDRMAIEAVAPAGEWWIPVPPIPAEGRLVVSSAAPVGVDFEVDVYGPDGLVEAAVEDVIPARAHVDIPLAELGEVSAVRVFAATPVVASVVFDGPGIRAGGPGSPGLALDWMVPGVSATGPGSLWVFNPGELDATVSVLPLSPAETSRSIVVPALGLVEIDVPGGGSGVALESDLEIAVAWTVTGETGLAYASGVPLGG